MVLVDWRMSEDKNKVFVCACVSVCVYVCVFVCVRTCAVVYLGGVGFGGGGGQVSVVDGTASLRASICETEWEEN